MNKFPKSLLRSMYDIQKRRIMIGNQIVAEIKLRMGQIPGTKEADLEAEEKNYLDMARAEYKRIADAFVLNKANQFFKVDYENYSIISEPAMLIFMKTYVEQLNHEEEMTKVIAKLVERHPLWDHFLRDTRGCGPLMSAVILSEFDIHKANRISSFWSYAGLDVAGDGRGRGRYKEHLVEQSYINKEGEEDKRNGITFNPFLKAKLVGVLGSSFIKQPADKCKYRKVYDDYKHRLEHHEKHKDKSKGHRHNMAVRYAVKIFLQDLWIAWRTVEGLDVTVPYHEGVLGHKHKGESAA